MSHKFKSKQVSDIESIEEDNLQTRLQGLMEMPSSSAESLPKMHVFMGR